ncbi:MAG: hypothetical protein ACI4T4_04960, partial [Limosilactobacillus sp.]
NNQTLYQLRITKPTFNYGYQPQGFKIVSSNSGDEGIFSVHGKYISSDEITNFLKDPLHAPQATLPTVYQWGLNLTGSRGIADIQIYGGSPLSVLFDLNNGRVVRNNGVIPLWKKLSATRGADNLTLEQLKGQQYEGLIWSRQKDGSINLWFNWSMNRLHDDWVNAIKQRYGSLENYFKQSLYTTLPGIDPERFAQDNAQAYHQFLKNNPLDWYQEIHIISYDPTVSNNIQINSSQTDGSQTSHINYGKSKPTTNTTPSKYQIQGHSFIKVHFIDGTSAAKDKEHAEVLLPEGPVREDGEKRTAWQGEQRAVSLSKLNGYDIVGDNQDINSWARRWGISPSKVLRSTSTTVTFPAQEGVTDDYYIFVRPVAHTINLKFVDDDNNGKVVTTDSPVTVTGTTGSAVPIVIPALAKHGYQLNGQPTLVIAYDNDGRPTYEADQEGNAVVHLCHQKESRRIDKQITRTVNLRMPDSSSRSVVQTAFPNRIVTHDLVTNVTTTQDQNGVWASVTIPVIAGYTSTINDEANDETTIAGQSDITV